MTIELDQIRESPTDRKVRVTAIYKALREADVEDEYGNVRCLPLRVLGTWRLCDPDPLKDYALKHGYRINEPAWPVQLGRR